MDCVLILFQRKLQPTSGDQAASCPKPSWAESLKVNNLQFKYHFLCLKVSTLADDGIDNFLAPTTKLSQRYYQ